MFNAKDINSFAIRAGNFYTAILLVTLSFGDYLITKMSTAMLASYFNLLAH
jgi:hypothetical protein